MPEISEMLLNLEVFQYDTSLDLDMVLLSQHGGNYKYKRLTVGVCNSPDILQAKVNKMFSLVLFIRAYINDLLIIAKSYFYDH